MELAKQILIIWYERKVTELLDCEIQTWLPPLDQAAEQVGTWYRWLIGDKEEKQTVTSAKSA